MERVGGVGYLDTGERLQVALELGGEDAGGCQDVAEGQLLRLIEQHQYTCLPMGSAGASEAVPLWQARKQDINSGS